MQALQPPGRGELGVDAPVRSNKASKSDISIGERTTGPRWYGGVCDIVWGQGFI